MDAIFEEATVIAEDPDTDTTLLGYERYAIQTTPGEFAASKAWKSWYAFITTSYEVYQYNGQQRLIQPLGVLAAVAVVLYLIAAATRAMKYAMIGDQSAPKKKEFADAYMGTYPLLVLAQILSVIVCMASMWPTMYVIGEVVFLVFLIVADMHFARVVAAW